MGKITDENYRKLEQAEKYEDADLEGMIDREFAAALGRMRAKKGLSTTAIAKNASHCKSYISRLSDPTKKNSKPSRNTVIDIALAMDANLEETNELLKLARYQELYTRDPAESLIIWGMLKKKSGSVIREMLEEKGLDSILKNEDK